mgnify:CR=1 FL=1
MSVSVSLLCDGDCSGQRRRICHVERSVDENDHFWAVVVDVVAVRRVMVMIVMISVGIVDWDDGVVVWWMIMLLVVVTVTEDHFYYYYYFDCHYNVVMCDD